MDIGIICGKSQDDAIYRSIESIFNIEKKETQENIIFYLLAFRINMCLHF